MKSFALFAAVVSLYALAIFIQNSPENWIEKKMEILFPLTTPN